MRAFSIPILTSNFYSFFIINTKLTNICRIYFVYLPMGKKAIIIVTESKTELKSLRKKQTSLAMERRVMWLLQFKTQNNSKRETTASKVNISLRTQERWIKVYMTKGIGEFLTSNKDNHKSNIITDEIHLALKERMNSSESPLLGYWDAVEWIKDEFDVEIKYHWLRKYLISHFKTKLKSPRKSHYKKDEQAIEAFLKTP